MPNPDQIIIEEVVVLDSIELNPLYEVDSIDVNTIDEPITVSLISEIGVDTVLVEDAQDNLIVDISISDTTAPVQSVNGKIGNVVIDYPDINEDPVNHVKYYHQQSSASDTWTIYHNLNFYPNVTVLNNVNQIIEADIQYLDANSVRIVMNASTSGKAYLS